MNRKEFAKKWGESYEPNLDKFIDCSTRLLSDLTEMLEQESKGQLLPNHLVINSEPVRIKSSSPQNRGCL